MRVRRFAVVGGTVAHSKSPVMQGAAMRALGLPHTYEAVHATAGDLRPSSPSCATAATTAQR